MRTQKQIEASRENGRKSHGATTPEGKARIVRANLDTGIFAEYQVLMWEHQEDLKELQDEYYARHPPASPEARCLLDQIILCEWHLRRFCWVEDSLWNELFTTSPQGRDECAYALDRGDRTFARLQHRINSTHRAFHTALKELERLEARDQDAVVVSPDAGSPATHSPETQLQILGSLRKKGSGDPATGTDVQNERRDSTHAGANIHLPAALSKVELVTRTDSECPLEKRKANIESNCRSFTYVAPAGGRGALSKAASPVRTEIDTHRKWSY